MTAKKRLTSFLNETAHQYRAPSLFWWSPGLFGRGLDASWACLGRNLGALGKLLGSLGRLFAASWSPFRRFLDALGRLWAFLGASGLDFGESWVPPGWVLEGSWAVFARIFEDAALVTAATTLLHSHSFGLFPFGAAVCAQHLE